MFHNQQGAFVEIGASSGVAFDRLGASTGAMGIDVSEPRGDARLAIAVANFANEGETLSTYHLWTYMHSNRPPWCHIQH